jgi:glycine betaine/proline transport system substrate-binding protein
MNGSIARRTFIALSAAAVGTVALSSCRATADTTSSPEKGTIRIGWLPWDEDVSVTYLWKRILEDNGYTVTLTQADAGPLYEALSTSSLDVFLDTWLPTTHADYWATYKDKLEDLAIWYDNARLTWAVPDYVDIDSIPDLAGHGSEFSDQIIGIEPGAGLTRISRDTVLPGYGLDGEYSLVESSTTAMLAELSRAISSDEPIAVTLWRPHWAYNTYPIKDLEDPEELLGQAEQVHIIARDGFSDEYPDVTRWLKAFVLDDTQLAALEDMVMNQYGSGQEEVAIDAWLGDDTNKALVDGWMAG